MLCCATRNYRCLPSSCCDISDGVIVVLSEVVEYRLDIQHWALTWEELLWEALVQRFQDIICQNWSHDRFNNVCYYRVNEWVSSWICLAPLDSFVNETNHSISNLQIGSTVADDSGDGIINSNSHFSFDLNFLVGSYLKEELLNILVNEEIHNAECPCRKFERSREFSRNEAFSFGQDAVLATNSSTQRNVSCSVLFVSHSHFDEWVIAVSKWSVGQLVPSSTRLDSVLLVRLKESSVLTVSSRSYNRALSYSRELDVRIGIESYVEVANRRSSEEAVVNPFINARTSRHWEHERHSQCEWAVTSNCTSNPCNRICEVGEGELNLFFLLFNSFKIELVPLSVTWVNGSTSIPVEYFSAVATESILVAKVKTKDNRLVCSYLEIELFNVLVDNFLKEVTSYAWNSNCEVHPCRNGERNFSQRLIVARGSSSEFDVRILVTLVDEGYLWEESKLVKEFLRNAVPLCTRSLLILNTLGDGSALLASGRILCSRNRYSSQFN